MTAGAVVVTAAQGSFPGLSDALRALDPIGRSQGRCGAGKAQALEDGGGDRRVGEKCQDLDRSIAVRAAKDIDLVHPTEEFRPRESARFGAWRSTPFLTIARRK